MDRERPLHILMLAPQPCFEPRGTPFSVLGRLKTLSRLGHKVDLITYHLGDNMRLPGLTIYRIPHVPGVRQVPIGPSGTKALLDVFVFAKAWRMLRRHSYDLLHTHEEAAFFGIYLAKWFRVRHLYDMHSSLPQQLENFRYSRLRPLTRVFEWLEGKAVRHSDAVITIAPALAQHVRELGSDAPQMMIENVLLERTPEAVTADEVHSFKDFYRLNGHKIVLYAGTFEPYQGLDLLVESAVKVLQRRQDVVFLLMGGQPPQVKRYQQQVRERGLERFFRFTGMRPPEEVPCALSLSHVLASLRISGTNTPLKLYAYLQAGKPLVATNLPTHTQVLSSDAALLVEPTSDAFAEGILSVCADGDLACQIGQRARRWFDEHYSLQTFTEKTAEILRQAVR